MRSLWTRLQLFLEMNELPLDDANGALFIHSLDVSVQAKHTYARNLANVFRKRGLPHMALTLFGTALKSRGALVPLHQARPMTKADLLRICRHLADLPARLLLLAWKTASRWDEVQRLKSSSFLFVSPQEIIIYFGQVTKTSRVAPFRPDLLCVVRGDGTQQLESFIREARHTKLKDEPLFPFETQKIRELLLPYNYSAHSIKRGAIMHLLNILPEGSHLLNIVPLLGKHAPNYPVLGDLTVRYSQEQTVVARHLGTGLLTCLL